MARNKTTYATVEEVNAKVEEVWDGFCCHGSVDVWICALSLVTQFALFLAKRRMQHSGALVCIVGMGFAPVTVGQEKPMSLGVVNV